MRSMLTALRQTITSYEPYMKDYLGTTVPPNDFLNFTKALIEEVICIHPRKDTATNTKLFLAAFNDMPGIETTDMIEVFSMAREFFSSKMSSDFNERLAARTNSQVAAG